MIDKRKLLGGTADPYQEKDDIWIATNKQTGQKRKVKGTTLGKAIVHAARKDYAASKKMEKAQTLADIALRETFKKRQNVMPQLRDPLSRAKRFVLDEAASAFLSDLAHANFIARESAHRAIDASIRLARLPHAMMWIEYDCHAERRRTLEAYAESARCYDGTPLVPPEECERRAGWLMRQHPHVDTAFRLTTIISLDDGAQQLPFDMAWTTNDVPLPWNDHVIEPGNGELAQLATGIVDYCNPFIGVMRNDLTPLVKKSEIQNLLLESGAELRRVFTLLAAINDVPVGVKHVQATHGFVAQGRYRKYLDHSIISILLPKGRPPSKIAREIIATSRRRAHEVRGFWRVDWRHPPRPDCQHVWMADDKHMLCEKCEGMKVWIDEHERGDASLGFVRHDYKVEYEEAS